MAKCLCSNDLNRYVTVKRIKSTATVDASGHIDETDNANWETLANEYCQIISQGSREFVVGDQLNQQLTHQITMRYSPRAAAYTTSMRLDYDGRKLNIAGPPQNIDEQNKWLRFGVTEVK